MKNGAFVWRVHYRTNVRVSRESVSLVPEYSVTTAVLTDGDALSDVRRSLEHKLFLDMVGGTLNIDTVECLGFGVYPLSPP